MFSAFHGGRRSFLNWKYTQLSQFSPCDTQLLVSGRNDVSELGGEIVIYNIYAGEFSVQVIISSSFTSCVLLSLRAYLVNSLFHEVVNLEYFIKGSQCDNMSAE